MVYIRFLRLRRSLLVMAIALAVLAAIVTYSLKTTHVDMHKTHAAAAASTSVTIGPGGYIDYAHSKGRIPLFAIIYGAGIFTVIYATVIAGSLNRQRDNLNLAWTKPIGKPELALRFMAADVVAIAVAFALLVAAVFVPIAAIGMLGHVDVSRVAWEVTALIFGVAVMWYGILQAATAWNRASAGGVAGLSWAVFFGIVIVQITGAGGTFVHTLLGVLDYLNPLAYFFVNVSNSGNLTDSALPLALDWRAIFAWTIGLAACAAAMFTWDRVEA